jgi:tRNA-Thr(GGU) m(6)t(6)A37 methyltransferase TsaA
VISTIVLDQARFTEESIRCLGEFSHVEVIFLLHDVNLDHIVTQSRHPRGRTDWPQVGIFAQRAKDRPNRIGLSVCSIVKIEGTRIDVSELDAIDGTPVLDIKPYLPQFGPRGDVRQPKWSIELMENYFSRVR